MRHDSHYVEELAAHQPHPIGRSIAVDSIDPNPEQPRTEIGDLQDLTASVREKGVLEPLLVKPSTAGRWMIIAGERRWRAAKAAGLREVPCIEMDIDERSVAEIALIENLQRKDLTVWEEADGLIALCEKYGYTHEDVAKKIGKSRTSVTESLSIASLPEAVREECRRADINSKSLLLQIVRQPDDRSMRNILTEITGKGITRDEARNLRKEGAANVNRNRPAQPSSFRYRSPEGDFQLEIKFPKDKAAGREAVENALKLTLEALESGEADSSSSVEPAGGAALPSE